MDHQIHPAQREAIRATNIREHATKLRYASNYLIAATELINQHLIDKTTQEGSALNDRIIGGLINGSQLIAQEVVAYQADEIEHLADDLEATSGVTA